MTMFAFESPADRTGFIRVQAEENVVYREVEGLDLHGGFMLVFQRSCRITMNITLSDEQKYSGADHMLRYRHTLEEQNGGIYWWFADGAETVQYAYSESPNRVRMLKRIRNIPLSRKLRQRSSQCQSQIVHR